MEKTVQRIDKPGDGRRIFKIQVTENGPYLVTGRIPLRKENIENDADGFPIRWKKGQEYPARDSYLLCRCGHSNDKPFCDNSHIRVSFNGRENDDKESFRESAKVYEGRNLLLLDAIKYCSSARFCERAGGIWKLTENSDDPRSEEIAIEEAVNCPSGRLVEMRKKGGQEVEPDFEPGISVTEEPERGISGPLWVKGGIKVESSQGRQYETRNRVTLCRCGRSHNKPFCDTSHVSINFDDSK